MKKNMKAIKKVMALVLVAMMIAAMSVSAWAAQVTMTIEGTDNHHYKVYQLFTGDLSTDGTTLSNVKYGANYRPADKNVGDAVPDNVLAGLVSASDADAYARNAVTNNAAGTPVGTLTYANQTLTGLSAGYYLIVDDTSIALSEGDAYSAYIVEILDDVTITAKKDTVTPDKKISTDTLGTDDPVNPHPVNDVADNVSVGDTVNFTLTGTVPAHATDYNYYYFILNDTLSDGLTFDAASVKVYSKNGMADAVELTAGTDYKLYTGDDANDKTTYADGKTFQVALIDAKALAGQQIIVTYSATLNENAVIGEAGNTNTFNITYSNNPNYDYDGDKDNNTPGKPDSTKPTPLTDTVDKTTETYTTGIQIQKVDENGNILTGAAFTIEGDSTQIVLTSVETFAQAGEGETGEYYLLKGGKYTKDAPLMADRMVAAPAGATNGYVVAEEGYAGPNATVVIDGTTYRVVNAGETPTYILEKKNDDLYEETTPNYVKTVTYEQQNTTTGTNATASVGADGIVTFNGLGAGEYTITETTTPNGYNTIAPITINIAFDKDGNPKWSKTSGDATYNQTTGVFETTIVNQKGSTLPSTGGIGTTIFYVVGTILVLGAGVVLVTRKRVNSGK